MSYGHFDHRNREYVITNPKTPVKWINYVGTLRFGGFVDHTGGVLLCKGDPALNRITKYVPQLPSSDFKGHTLYVRVRDGREQSVFSPFFVPTLQLPDVFECHVGLGYSRFVCEFRGLRTEVTLFVPREDPILLEDVRITNHTDRELEIDAIPVFEYTHFDALKQFTNSDWVPQTMQSEVYDEGDGRIILAQSAFMKRDRTRNYFTANMAASSFETRRASFLGDNEYGTWRQPLSLQHRQLGGHVAFRGDNIGALLLPLGTLPPGESRRFRSMLTQTEGTRAQSLSAAKSLFARYQSDGEADLALQNMARFWDAYLSALQVQTPEPAMNAMLNTHNPRQCYVTKNWARDLSLYQLGFGGRGIGFRDGCQDLMGVLAQIPDEARELLERLLSVQRPDGSAMHQFFASTMEANEGDAREYDDRPKFYGDDHLWSVLAVCAYVAETGDVRFLDSELPFYDPRSPLRMRATVFEHMLRAVEFTRKTTGRHGLPLLGFADWNDTVNLKRGAESLFVANLYGKALLELAELCRELGRRDVAERLRCDYAQMRERVNAVAWDGQWYVRYFDWDGTPIGTHESPQGQIWTNGQSWPVISGFAPPDRARTALDSVRRLLNTNNGIKLSGPGYDGYDPDKGGVTTYPPGAKENGGIFLHANPWVMIAETLLGRGDRAFEYYLQINPAAKNDCIEQYECEPYVYAQNILGDEHPQFGLARNSWLSGTASWAYQAATQYILGVRPSYRGLIVDPCIPAAWSGFEMVRRHRGATYQIGVTNPKHVSKGVSRVCVDGKEIAGNVLPVFTSGEHRVDVVLGS